MATHDIVAIGTSAGGVKALRTLAAALPSDYAGALLVVMHLSPHAPSHLAAILDPSGPLPAVTASDGMDIRSGRIHVAPADHHMLIERDRLRVVRGPRENRHRPAIDPLFRSAAWAYGPRAVGVVLTGNLDDGMAGLWAIKSCGGVAIVQEPTEAEHPEMPMNALMNTPIDHRLPLADIAALLVRLAQEPIDATPIDPPPASLALETEAAKLDSDMADTERLGVLSPFTCPACRGALWEIDEEDHLRYRCHVGHAYSMGSLMVDQTNAVEESLFIALRAVEEKAAALRRLAERWPEQSSLFNANYESRARDLDQAAGTLRDLLAGARR